MKESVGTMPDAGPRPDPTLSPVRKISSPCGVSAPEPAPNWVPKVDGIACTPAGFTDIVARSSTATDAGAWSPAADVPPEMAYPVVPSAVIMSELTRVDCASTMERPSGPSPLVETRVMMDTGVPASVWLCSALRMNRPSGDAESAVTEPYSSPTSRSTTFVFDPSSRTWRVRGGVASVAMKTMRAVGVPASGCSTAATGSPSRASSVNGEPLSRMATGSNGVITPGRPADTAHARSTSAPPFGYVAPSSTATIPGESGRDTPPEVPGRMSMPLRHTVGGTPSRAA